MNLRSTRSGHTLNIAALTWTRAVSETRKKLVRSNCLKLNSIKLLGVFEPTKIKTKSLKLATEAATTILRIDDSINLHPTEGKQKSYSDALAAGELDG